MGASSGRKDEVDTGHKPVPIDLANTVIKSICKIVVKLDEYKYLNGTGFFMKISDSIKCLITNYHVIKPDFINKKIEIELWNHKKIKLNLNEYTITFIKKPKDITMIQMKNSREIFKEVEFLDYDSNYKKGYKIYKNANVFSIQHPLGKSAASASGTILSIDDYEFSHTISTDEGSSGCPILLLNNNIDLVLVIGIHKYGDKKNKINGGTFIGEIFKEINNSIIDNKKSENYIISELDIRYLDINKEIMIINSFEEWVRNYIKDEPNNEDFKKNMYLMENLIKILLMKKI